MNIKLLNKLKKGFHTSNFLEKTDKDKTLNNPITPRIIQHKNKKKNKKKRTRLPIKKILKKSLVHAGFEYTQVDVVIKKVKNIIITILILISLIIVFRGVTTNIGWTILTLAIVWTLGAILVVSLVWAVVFFFLDLKTIHRHMSVEEMFPDFLMLTASNINAGMTVDKAILYAIRPQFGPLAKDMEEVAKATMAGEDLSQSLRNFANKYNSMNLKRSISLIIEGLRSGGAIADLLNKIALNIQDNRILRKDMAANITTYIIFITFATMIGAPFLFGLATVLVKVIGNIMGSVRLETIAGAGMPFSFSSQTLKVSDFKLYSIISLMITSVFSGAIISSIKTGRLIDSWRYILGFIVVSIFLYLIIFNLLSGLLSQFI